VRESDVGASDDPKGASPVEVLAGECLLEWSEGQDDDGRIGQVARVWLIVAIRLTLGTSGGPVRALAHL
jgi:hypothetical protein